MKNRRRDCFTTFAMTPRSQLVLSLRGAQRRGNLPVWIIINPFRAFRVVRGLFSIFSGLSQLLCVKRSFLSKKQAQSGMKPALCLLITMLLCYGSGRHDANQRGFSFRLHKHLRPDGDLQIITMNKSAADHTNRS